MARHSAARAGPHRMKHRGWRFVTGYLPSHLHREGDDRRRWSENTININYTGQPTKVASKVLETLKSGRLRQIKNNIEHVGC